ncbi:hypothetical protein MPTK1_2g06010 [Marchantia polymorpha subsp. ruderalis]|uniref:Uncharacterized protein n=2 Tax=Marchantia polymorpha TaxID=3197 RepID=A0A176VSR6_MARPO|nr:hypothetical protein AXG93_3986s1100 [Marchantia polymorpha subsp. ruderalis]PTQ44190.1 hypothetical protein MARPO_0021s0056 [Marchantia polymorpha]BBN01265.1 hypothetical protein Mp_2g06010 [Marchantia polymorpha subsp. ruderalis]|eukprot:PTQ44190.1 hypothetical protein MARPO_0021s0056 [Marchantia polymorpha]
MLEDPVFLSWSKTNVCQELSSGGCSASIMNDFAHWPFFACLLVVIVYVSLAIKFVRQYEGPGRPRGRMQDPYMGVWAIGDLDGGELWKCCWGALHPGWLFGFRLVAFCYFLPQVLYNFYMEGFWMFYFYTQWTFILLIAYFGVAAWISAVHCLKLNRDRAKTSSNSREEIVKLTAPDSTSGELSDIKDDIANTSCTDKVTESPGLVGYVMQVFFQVAATAVMMTDFVYWLILVPYVLPKTFKHTFIDINMHFVNAIFLIIEISLNSLYYPWFRGAYVVFWSATYIIFQWVLHAIGFQTWPYPFLDLATPWAPAWYAGLSLFHLALFVLVMLLVNMKQHLFSRGIHHAESRLTADRGSN